MADKKNAAPLEAMATDAQGNQGPRWTLERCKKAAKRFATVADWQAGAPSSYKAAAARQWVAQCSAHMKATAVKTAKADRSAAKKTTVRPKKSA